MPRVQRFYIFFCSGVCRKNYDVFFFSVLHMDNLCSNGVGGRYFCKRQSSVKYLICNVYFEIFTFLIKLKKKSYQNIFTLFMTLYFLFLLKVLIFTHIFNNFFPSTSFHLSFHTPVLSLPTTKHLFFMIKFPTKKNYPFQVSFRKSYFLHRFIFILLLILLPSF